MKEYPHIDSVYKRDAKGNFMLGEFSKPEFEYLKDNPWIWTEKIDGTNIRIMWDGDEVWSNNGEPKFTFGGKTDNAQIPSKLVTWLNVKVAEWLPGIKEGNHEAAAIFVEGAKICLYGEGYGSGIQKGGGLYSLQQKFILFDV